MCKLRNIDLDTKYHRNIVIHGFNFLCLLSGYMFLYVHKRICGWLLFCDLSFIENWHYTIGITITVTVMVAAKLVKCMM